MFTMDLATTPLELFLEKSAQERATLQAFLIDTSFKPETRTANFFPTFYTALSDCTALKSLILEYNFLWETKLSDFKEFCERLAQLPELESLTIRYNELSQLDDQRLDILLSALEKSPKLKELNLNGNSLCGFKQSFLRKLGNRLAKYPHLEKLDLRSNLLGHQNDGLETFFQDLSRCPKLQILDLSSNDLEKVNANTFRALANPQLQVLILRGNYIGILKPEPFESLCEALKHCNALTHLDLSDCALHNLDKESGAIFGERPGLVSLSNTFAQCPRLTLVNLKGNQLTPEQTAQLQSVVSNTMDTTLTFGQIASGRGTSGNPPETTLPKSSHGAQATKVFRFS